MMGRARASAALALLALQQHWLVAICAGDVSTYNEATCAALAVSLADVDTVSLYPTFDFQMGSKHNWDETFERRYQRTRNDTSRPPLKVIVVPHSHNDPGSQMTFAEHLEATKPMINRMIRNLRLSRNMTFAWSEMACLSAWWESAHPLRKKALKRLIDEGRLEITTGGLVMADEASTHIYALIDQLIEEHLWVKSNLGITPKTGWSIDAFGHGPTVPFLLERSGLEGTVIHRIHYAWKRWFAKKQIEDFHWIPGWNVDWKPTMVVHNLPFDMHSFKESCGPHRSVCLSFDFRSILGHEDITEQNLDRKSNQLIEEYSRIGSLTPHNVVLVPLADDFRYEHPVEFDIQYNSYMNLFNYINSHPEMFNAEVHFGTPLDYFNALLERQYTMPILKGDFFFYADIYSDGKPSHRSGFYTTRPYFKILARQLEHNLRSAEILFTLVFQLIKQAHDPKLTASQNRIENYYKRIIRARRNLGLSQHHDAITGTYKANVTADYVTKLFTSLKRCVRFQEIALSVLMIPDTSKHNLLQSALEWEMYSNERHKVTILVSTKRKIVLFNPLNDERTEVITVRTNSSQIKVYDSYRSEYVLHQVNPTIEMSKGVSHLIREASFDILFVAQLPPLTVVTFTIEETTDPSHMSIIYCSNSNYCNQTNVYKEGKFMRQFRVKNMVPGDIQLENTLMKLSINRQTGFLKQVYRKDTNKDNVMEMSLGAYQSDRKHSGPYLFMPNYNTPEEDVISQYSNRNSLQDKNIIIVSGKIATEITTLYQPFLVHTVRIFNIDHRDLSEAIYIENIVNFEVPPENLETDLFMRIHTGIQNGEPPVFYTDQNGFQYQRRVKVDKLNIEANYYPITTMAWLQDKESRVTLLTDHAQGAAALEPGRIELMLDQTNAPVKRHDDLGRMSEDVEANERTIFQHWLLLESMEGERAGAKRAAYQLPSLRAHYLSRIINYPVHVLLLEETDGEVALHSHRSLVQHFPPEVHVVTLRTLTDGTPQRSPSSSSLLVLQGPAASCAARVRGARARRAARRRRRRRSLHRPRRLHRAQARRPERRQPQRAPPPPEPARATLHTHTPHANQNLQCHILMTLRFDCVATSTALILNK